MNQNEEELLKNGEESNAEIETDDKKDTENNASVMGEEAAKSDDNSDMNTGDATIDYEALEKEDMRELIALFPHLEGKVSVRELDNPLRYAALRDLGLTPKEAYLATNGTPYRYDNRSHLRSSVPQKAGIRSDLLGAKELEAAREIFSGLSDREIQKLYKKVSR